MLYGSPIYYPLIKAKTLTRLQRLQNWAVRVLFLKKPRYRNCRKLLERARWIRIKELLKVNYAVHCYQASLGDLGRELFDCFTLLDKPQRRVANKRYHIPNYTLHHTKSMKTQGPKLLNQLIPIACNIMAKDNLKATEFRKAILKHFRDEDNT